MTKRMMKLKKGIAILITGLILCTLNNVAARESSNYSFKHYNINNGLSQNTVHCILQDKMGFMWFGTKDGLNRFDGTSFKIFKFSPEGELRDNVFHNILEDKNGNLWVATEGGIYVYDPRLEKFNRFDPVTPTGESLAGWISDFAQDMDGDLWISIEEKGVFYFNVETEHLTFYPIPTLRGGMRTISLCVGNKNDIWVFPYGLPMVRIDKETGQAEEFQVNGDPDFFSLLGEVRNVIIENNQLILPTSHRGLGSINIAKREYQPLLESDSKGQPIFVRTVKRIDNQTLWIGSESGVYILNTGEDTVDRANLNLLRRNVAADVGEQRDKGCLAHIGAFTAHVGAGNDQHSSLR